MISRSTSEAIVGIEPREIERHDRRVRTARTSRSISAVADLAARSGNQHDRFAHDRNYTERVMRFFLLALLLWSTALAGAAARAAAVVRTDHARRLLPHRWPEIRRDLRARPRRQRRPLARQPDAAGRRDGPWPLPLRGARRRERRRCCIRGDSRRSTASGKRPPKRRSCIGPSTSRCASRGRPHRCASPSRDGRRGERLRDVWTTEVDPGVAVRQQRDRRRRAGTSGT